MPSPIEDERPALARALAITDLGRRALAELWLFGELHGAVPRPRLLPYFPQIVCVVCGTRANQIDDHRERRTCSDICRRIYTGWRVHEAALRRKGRAMAA